jgi:Arc/MetJ-type ribon-helix-helix transcriptional regulator
MGKTSVRLSPEMDKELQIEVRKMCLETGERVTVSDLIRTCIAEKFPQVCARAKSERKALSALMEEVARLGDRSANLERDVELLVKKLSDILPVLSTGEQVADLTKSIEKVFRALRGV